MEEIQAVSLLVVPQEVGLFEEFLRLGQWQVLSVASFALGALKRCIMSDLKAVLGKQIDLKVQGSFRKNTFWANSDVDVMVETGDREVTREEQVEVERRLSKNPALAHVGLGRAAIHLTFFNTDVDLVFSNLRDEGKAPPAAAEVINNSIVQLASVGLKLAVNEQQVHRIANFLLENLAVEIQHKKNAENGLELFLNVAQAVVDTKGEILNSPCLQPALTKKERKKSLSPATIRAAFNRLSSSLHLFCISRYFLGSFSTKMQIEQWLRQSQDTGLYAETIPGWMLGVPPPKNTCEKLISATPQPSSPSLTEEEIKSRFLGVVQSYGFEIFLESPQGKYVLLPHQTKQSSSHCRVGGWSDKMEELELLREHWILGSKVAGQMLEARQTWVNGSVAFNQDDLASSIELWANALLLSHPNGDPFFGWWSPHYHSPLKKAYGRDRKNPACAVVFSSSLMHIHQLREAQEVVESCLKSHPDHLGLLFNLLTICAHRPDPAWQNLVQLCSRMIALNPDEPIYVYWKAVCLKNTHPPRYSEGIENFEKFLSKAAPEGRKVPAALKDIALLRLAQEGNKSRASKKKKAMNSPNQFLCEYRKGIEADSKVLPMLQEREPPIGDQMYQMFLAASSGTSAVESLMGSSVRERGNQYFAQGNYLEAIETYSMIASEDCYALSNRSLCYLKVGSFSKAAKDAEELVKLRPDWVKSFLRLADAYLHLKQRPKALEACRDGLSLFPDCGELVALKKKAQLLPQSQKLMKQKIQPENLSCFPDVKFKDNCKVIEANGKGDYVCLSDAIDNHSLSEKPISFILLGGRAPINTQPLIITSSAVQIIGLRNGDQKKGSEKRPLLQCDDSPSSLFVVHGKGAELFLQDIDLNAIGHCVYVLSRGSAHITNCCARGKTFASFGGEGGQLILRRCDVPSKSFGGIAVERTRVIMRECHFDGTVNVSIAVRESSKCDLFSCTITNSKAQAIGLVCNGKEVTMENCLISQCGCAPSKSGLLLEAGVMKLKGCDIKGNKAEGIVVQGTGEAHLVMENCYSEGNGAGGVSIYQGSGNISSCNMKDYILFGNHIPRQSFVRNCKASSIFTLSPSNVTLKDNTEELPGRGLPSHEIKKIGKAMAQQSVFSQSSIPPNHFDLMWLVKNHLKMLSSISQVREMVPIELTEKITAPQVTIGKRTCPDHQLQPTTIRKAWNKPSERSEGKVLVGFSQWPVTFITSVMAVIRDSEGSGILIAFKNLPVNDGMSVEEAQKLLPIGSKITLKEPSFAGFSMGTLAFVLRILQMWRLTLLQPLCVVSSVGAAANSSDVLDAVKHFIVEESVNRVIGNCTSCFVKTEFLKKLFLLVGSE
eukprot:CAMPEP_0201489108 /NCGR_PEP_ID=MMETSP0151_2-20130828/21027_1 /ASSEMBLY_ACC=CAM_ASM_000257 /TAXON_ID=200890 /ORGANISM="Paramoeba atlantica, Strain 621/1 / CCAP 1560/9" /LENGTH=1341 /DNA_ID=CAMNT_0047874589 /DNA_START=16 /DNA_END=4042 /DNA_ORIENTATION=+